MASNVNATYTGSYSFWVLGWVGAYYPDLFTIGLSLTDSNELWFSKGDGSRQLHFYETSEGRYLLQDPASGNYIVGQLSSDQSVMRYYATATSQDAATAFSVQWAEFPSGASLPCGVTDDQGYHWSYYIDASPYNPSQLDSQELFGRQNVPDGYGSVLMSFQRAPAPNAAAIQAFKSTRLAQKGQGDGQVLAGVNWQHAQLGAFDLSGWSLTAVNFANAQLAGASLNGCRLTKVSFSAAQVDDLDLRGASMLGMVFDHVDMTQLQLDNPPDLVRTEPGVDTPVLLSLVGATFEISMLQKNWSHCNMAGANVLGLVENMDWHGLVARYSTLGPLFLQGANLSNADFTQSDLSGSPRGANLSGATLVRANFASANLTNANLNNAVLQHANFNPDSSMATPRSTNLTGVELAGADLSSATLQNAVLLGVNASGAVLEQADMTGAQLGGQNQSEAAVFSYAYMANAILDKANLYGVDFSFASFYGASASVADTSTLQEARFSNAYLEGIDFSNANLQGSNFAAACLVNCNFSGVDFSPTNQGSVGTVLSGTCLQGANFANANLDGASLTNAAVSFANGSIPVQHCSADGVVTPATPQKLTYGPTQGLDCSSLRSTTICPNGSTLATNEADVGVSNCQSLTAAQLQDFLSAPGAPQSWTPASCARAGNVVVNPAA